MRRLRLLALAVTIALCAPPADASDDHRWPGRARYSVDVVRMAASLDCRGGVERLDGRGRAEPVLLVPGTGMTRRQAWEWNYWRALPAAGFETCWVAPPRASYGDAQVASEYVAWAVEVIADRTGERVDVVGHSQGGLQARWAVRWFAAGTSVDDVVALGTPNHGTLVADAAAARGECFPSCWQMRMGSSFLTALNSTGETPGPISYTSIYSRADEVVVPAETARLAGAANIVIQDVCPGRPVDHAGLLGDNVTYRLVIDALVRRGPANAERLEPRVCTTTTLPRMALPDPDVLTSYDPDVRFTDREPPTARYAR